MKTPGPKRNLWPFGIILAFALFILGTTALIALACSGVKDDLVATDYYERDLRFQTRLDSLNRAQRLPDGASIAFDAGQQVIVITLPREHAARFTQGSVQLYRPSAAELDQQLELHPDNAGVQSLDAAQLRRGLWRVKVVWTVAGEEFAVERSVVVGTKNS